MNIFTKLKNAKYVQKFIITLSISLLIIIAGVVMTCVKGMNLGIEFTGGIKVSVEADDVTDKKEFENTLSESGSKATAASAKRAKVKIPITKSLKSKTLPLTATTT